MTSSGYESDSYSSSSSCSTPLTPSHHSTPQSSSEEDEDAAFRLIHRTNHQGYFILPEPADRHFPVSVIWTQVDWSNANNKAGTANPKHPQQNHQHRSSPGCCPRMGRRVVTVAESDFPHHDHHPKGHWYLFCVQVVQKPPQQPHVNNIKSPPQPQHVYYKFVVAPTNRMNGMLKHGGLVLRKHCILLDLRHHMARMRTNVLYRERRQQLEHPNKPLMIQFHFHVGLVLDVLRTELDTPQAIYDYQLACYQAIDECEDEAELDEWIDRARQATTSSSTLPRTMTTMTHTTTHRSQFQPPKLSDAIPEMILVDHNKSPCQLELTRNFPDPVWTEMEDATRDATATSRG